MVGPAAPVSEPLPGVRAYLDLGTAGVVAAMVQLQQPTVLPVPVNLSLLGTEWVAQLAVVPGPGSVAPPFQAPPGGRFAL